MTFLPSLGTTPEAAKVFARGNRGEEFEVGSREVQPNDRPGRIPE